MAAYVYLLVGDVGYDMMRFNEFGWALLEVGAGGRSGDGIQGRAR